MRLKKFESGDMATMLELPVYIDCDIGDDNTIDINAVWLVQPGVDDIELALTPALKDSAASMVEWELVRKHDQYQAMQEDWAESRMNDRKEIARQEQQYALDESATNRSIMRDTK